jgi:D-aminoacyl-tRNA deacylase
LKAVVQRVSGAAVVVEKSTVSEIGNGLLVFLGIERGDDLSDISYLVKKLSSLRIFEDEKGRMNLSVGDVEGKMLVISQFTLCADCRRGNRPSFDKAEEPSKARELYSQFIEDLRKTGAGVETGIFGAFMQVVLTNSGPVTILLDSKKYGEG